MLHFCPGLPILLLGFKSDLQNDTKTAGKLLEMGQKPVTQAEVSLFYIRSSEGNLIDKNDIGGGSQKTVYGYQVLGIISKDRSRRSGDDRRNLSNYFTKPSLEALQAIRSMSLTITNGSEPRTIKFIDVSICADTYIPLTPSLALLLLLR